MVENQGKWREEQKQPQDLYKMVSSTNGGESG